MIKNLMRKIKIKARVRVRLSARERESEFIRSLKRVLFEHLSIIFSNDFLFLLLMKINRNFVVEKSINLFKRTDWIRKEPAKSKF